MSASHSSRTRAGKGKGILRENSRPWRSLFLNAKVAKSIQLECVSARLGRFCRPSRSCETLGSLPATAKRSDLRFHLHFTALFYAAVPLWSNIFVQLRDTLHQAIARLTAENIPSPRMNAELLLMFTLSCDRAYVFAYPERELTTDEQSRYDAALAERSRGVPAQYITGHQEFWGMDLIVSPAVLIPRPETEHIIEVVLELLPNLSDVRIVDVGTGSGCIA